MFLYFSRSYSSLLERVAFYLKSGQISFTESGAISKFQEIECKRMDRWTFWLMPSYWEDIECSNDEMRNSAERSDVVWEAITVLW